MDVVEFLRARLDEDEQAAYDADGSIGKGHMEWTFQDGGDLGGKVVASDVDLVSDVTTGPGQHIARHDPARVLAEVESKRKLIAEVWDYEEGFPTEHTSAREAEAVLKHLALPYADHEDYREEWRP